ncbi:pirin isoform X1 [Heptranchias perlo]|uniref:pirin isoform X1 n=1 Tax=Heptranchias perlo TaxID=212740 RepID=UPI00355AC0BC
MSIRKIVQIVLAVEQSEGVGAQVRRSIGRWELKSLDPFLMLDEFKVSKPAGFPDHPHRGFETEEAPHHPRQARSAVLGSTGAQDGGASQGPAEEQRGDQWRGRDHRREYRQRLIFLDLSEEQSPRRLRLSHQVIADVCRLLQEELLRAGPGGHALPVVVKVNTALNFITSRSFQGSTGDITRISQSSVHKCIRQVTDLVCQGIDYVNFPIEDISQTERAVSFHSLTGFPWVQGAIDCTHVAIQGPAHGQRQFINGKGYQSINAQLVCWIPWQLP